MANGCGSIFKDFAFYTGTPICTPQTTCSGVGPNPTSRSSLSVKTENPTLVSISPNPSSGQFTIKLSSDDVAVNIKQVIIIDKMGAPIFKQSFSTNEKTKQINLFNQPLDNYIVKVYDGTTWHTQKLIITK